MKEFIRFVWRDDHYWAKDTKGETIDLLALFLLTDVDSFGIYFVIECAEESDGVDTHGDATFIETHNGIMTVGDLLDRDDPTVSTFSLPCEQFRNLLIAWEAAVKLKPKEIIITKDGDKVTLETRD